MKYVIFGVIALLACDAPADTRSLDLPTSVDQLRIVRPKVVSVTVTPANASAYPAGSIQFIAVARDGQGRLLRASAWEWRSSDTSVAIVSQTGLATGRNIGNGVITAIAYPPWSR